MCFITADCIGCRRDVLENVSKEMCDFNNLSCLTPTQPFSLREAWSDLCKILRTLVADTYNANACFPIERLGGCATESATAVTFS